MTAYRPLPDALTAPLPEPSPPAANCVFQGKPAVCVPDALGAIVDYRAALRTCNDDRARAALLGKSDGQTGP